MYEEERDWEEIAKEAAWMMAQYYNAAQESEAPAVGAYWRGCISGTMDTLKVTGKIDRGQYSRLLDLLGTATKEQQTPGAFRKQTLEILLFVRAKK